MTDPYRSWSLLSIRATFLDGYIVECYTELYRRTPKRTVKKMYDYVEAAGALQATFDHEIPITRHIGIRVANYNGERLALSAPLKPNINHKATTFAGSLNSLVTLAGWGLIWLLLKEWDISATIVIQDSTINYRRPVTRDFLATCFKPDAVELAYFARMLREKGKARLELQAEIRENDAVAVSFQGRYVVRLQQA